jgi:hypothetical protein
MSVSCAGRARLWWVARGRAVPCVPTTSAPGSRAQCRVQPSCWLVQNHSCKFRPQSVASLSLGAAAGHGCMHSLVVVTGTAN